MYSVLISAGHRSGLNAGKFGERSSTSVYFANGIKTEKHSLHGDRSHDEVKGSVAVVTALTRPTTTGRDHPSCDESCGRRFGGRAGIPLRGITRKCGKTPTRALMTEPCCRRHALHPPSWHCNLIIDQRNTTISNLSSLLGMVHFHLGWIRGKYHSYPLHISDKLPAACVTPLSRVKKWIFE